MLKRDPHAKLGGKNSQEVRSMKMSEAIQDWAKTKRDAGRAQATIEQHEGAVKLFVRDVGDLELGDLTTEMLQRHLVGRYPVASTRRKRQAQLRAFLNWCKEKRGWISENPAKRLEPVTVERGTKEPLTPDELDRIRAAADGPLRAAIEYMLFLRPVEFLKALPGDVDPDARSMRVYRGKTHSWQNIEATDEMILFRNHLGAWGTPRTPREKFRAVTKLERHFRRLADRAGIPPGKRTPYVLRHTGATMWAARYRDPFRLMAQMGWDDVLRATTYVHQAERSAWAARFPRVDLETISAKLDRILTLLERLTGGGS